MSLSADEYIRRVPYVSDNGEITLGLKNTTAFLVDAITGRVVRTYRLDGSSLEFESQVGKGNALVLPKNTDGLLEHGGSDLGSYQNLVYITRTDYMLQHFSPNSSKVQWKVAFAEMEAEFRCQSSFPGVSLDGDMDTNDYECQLPCQMKTNVLRIRDDKFSEFEKMPIALLGGGARFLPASVQAPPLGPSGKFTLALPADGVKPMLPDYAQKPLALPASKPEGNAEIMEFSNLHSHANEITHMWSVIMIHQLWFVIATVFSILSGFFYFLTLKKRGKSTEPVKELKLQSGLPKKKKTRRSGSKTGPKRDGQQKSPSETEVVDADRLSQVEESERKLFLTFPNLTDSHADGRRVGKLLVTNKEIAKGSNGTVVLEGIYDGRPVAVKRLVQTHHDVALKEIQNLIASDQHPNIVRWYGVEFDQDFVYLALERCNCSLSDLIYVYSDSFQSHTLPSVTNSNCLPEYTIRLPSMLEQDGSIELWKANGYPSEQLLKLMRLV